MARAGPRATEPPHAVDLLERAGLAVGPRQLLDDERHALGLGVLSAADAASTGPPRTR